ncbi:MULTISPECIES: polysaccharide biosynthesis/export family protein [unclassified Sphingobacterium]|uniref:polysaccharide biosynthesis/export family protein n=1 Tax=unclassified Sphingobacterium TaxID=2609468 RepID=UPI00265D21F9|nr:MULTISPECIES: polysaccharide biosynthesis/export family protein [unclassified Sphingobacterium]WKK59882.1 polysaccharide biosynthesis/export family protein [Sphingobacterium sp. BN32]
MNKNLLFIAIVLTVLFTGCSVGQKVIYVKDMPEATEIPISSQPALTVQKNDRLSIIVSAKNPELAAPFNDEMVGYSVGRGGEVFSKGTTTNRTGGYLVDQQGNIEFPILGTIAVEGKSVEQIKDLIKRRLVEEKYINDPIVKVELTNIRISMAGEINSRGVIEVPDGRITLIEAISKAGGLSRNAASDRITVIREENGMRKKIIVDIEKQAIFDSPAYYLKQNDVVFIEPKDDESTPKEERTWRLISFGLGLVTVVLTVLNFVR